MKDKQSQLKEGDHVDYHSIIDGPVTSTGHVIETIHRMPNNFGTDVAWISSKSGCVALDALTKTPVEAVEYWQLERWLWDCPRCGQRHETDKDPGTSTFLKCFMCESTFLPRKDSSES